MTNDLNFNFSVRLNYSKNLSRSVSQLLRENVRSLRLTQIIFIRLCCAFCYAIILVIVQYCFIRILLLLDTTYMDNLLRVDMWIIYQMVIVVKDTIYNFSPYIYGEDFETTISLNSEEISWFRINRRGIQISFRWI